MKDLEISEVKQAKDNIPDLKVYGDGDTFELLCKASSQEQGWMKSTKVCNVYGGCIVQVTTQQRNPDNSYSCAEALTFVPGNHLDTEVEPRVLKQIPIHYYTTTSTSYYEELEAKAKKYDELMKEVEDE